MSKCDSPGKEATPKKVKTVPAGKQTWTRKNLKKGANYKFYVVAQKKVNGKFVNIAVSRTGHVVTNNGSRRYTNPKSLKLNRTKVTLSPGKSVQIKGKVTKVKPGKKLLPATHAAKLRYISSDSGVAAVSAAGKITAVAKGSCKIYVQAVNGIWKTVQVTVK